MSGRTDPFYLATAPVTTGNDRLERTIGAHLNMLEWFSIVLPALSQFALD